MKTFTILMHEVDRAVVDGEEDGFVKLHVREGTAEILGAAVVASHAGDLINEISLAPVRAADARSSSVPRRNEREASPAPRPDPGHPHQVMSLQPLLGVVLRAPAPSRASPNAPRQFPCRLPPRVG